MKDLEREAVALAVGEPLDEHVRHGHAAIGRVRLPGGPEGALWTVRLERLAHPILLHVGQYSDGRATVVTDDPKAWEALVADVGVRLDSADVALDYARCFLEATRGHQVFVREVARPEDLPFRPGSEHEEERRREVLADLEIPPPNAEQSGDGFHVELTLVVDQRLQRNHFEVTRDGAIEATFDVLADGLPFPTIL